MFNPALYAPIFGGRSHWYLQAKADGVDPSLYLDFLNQRYAANSTAKNFTDILTLTRASSKWVFNSSGVLTEVLSNQPAYDYNPVTGAPKGILIEGLRTNILAYSVPTTGQWGNFDASVSYNNYAAPNGLTAASLITASATTNVHAQTSQSVSFTSGTTYTFSVFVRAGTSNKIQLAFGSAAFGAQYTNFSLTGAGSVLASSGHTKSSITQCANGWYRLSVTAAATVTTTTASMLYFINSDTATYGPSFLAAGTESFYSWGGQIESAAFPSSYIPTSGAAVTRSADVMTVSASTPVPFADWYNTAESTIYAEHGAVVENCALAQIDDTTNNNRLSLNAIPDGAQQFVAVSGGTQVSSFITGVSASIYKTAAEYKLNDFSISTNGVTPVTDTAGTIPTVSLMTIGSRAGGLHLNGHLRELRYYPKRISNSELQRITT